MKLFFLLTCFAAEAIISKLECSTSNFVEQKSQTSPSSPGQHLMLLQSKRGHCPLVFKAAGQP